VVVEQIQIAGGAWEVPLDPDIEWQSVFSPDEACDMLRDFLNTALEGKRRELVIREKPQGKSFLTIVEAFSRWLLPYKQEMSFGLRLLSNRY
jgi:hypothetical protein